MDWFLYDNGLRHERVKAAKRTFHYHSRRRSAMPKIFFRVDLYPNLQILS